MIPRLDPAPCYFVNAVRGDGLSGRVCAPRPCLAYRQCCHTKLGEQLSEAGLCQNGVPARHEGQNQHDGGEGRGRPVYPDVV